MSVQDGLENGDYLETGLGTLQAVSGAGQLSNALSAGSKVSNAASSSKNGQSVFWTGMGDDGTKAGNWASKNGGTTLEMTSGAKNLPEWSPQTASQWDSASRNFAKNANGDVTVLVGPNGIRDGSTFNRVEFPELLNNKNVNSINFIYLDN